MFKFRLSYLVIIFSITAAVATFIYYQGSKRINLGTISAGEGNVDDPQARNEWIKMRYADPETGEIPANIRHMEMLFAKSFPQNPGSRNLEWLARGPYNVGGRTRAIAMDINNPDRIIAGGVTGGMWLSENAGQSWTRVTGPSHFPAVSTLVQDTRPGKTNIWYYGTGEIRGGYVSSEWFNGDGMYKSVDNGLTWQPLESTIFNIPQSFNSDWNFVSRVAVDVSNDTLDVVYASTYGGLYRSENGGDTWTKKVGNISPTTYYSDMSITNTGVVYFTSDSESGDKGIWRSEDGLTWTNILPADTFPPVYDRIVIGINPVNENEVYFLASTPNYGQHSEAFFGYEDWNSLWKYTYLSGDGSGTGGEWVNLSANIPNNGLPFDNFYTQSCYNMMIAVSPHNPNVVIIGATNLYRSTDGFTSMNSTSHIGGYWEGSHLPSGYWGSYTNHHPDQHALLFHPTDSNIIISGNDGGVFKSLNALDNEVEWERMNNGYNTTQAYTVGFDRTGTDDVLIGGFQDNANYFVNSADTTALWVMPLNGDGAYMGIAPDKEFYCLSINRGKIYKMDLNNDGAVQSFVRIDPGQVNPDDYLFINPLLLDPSNSDVLYVAGGRKLWRHSGISDIPYTNSHDSIFTGWSYLPDTLTTNNIKISAIATSVGQPNTLWYGTSVRRIFKVTDPLSSNPTTVQMPLSTFPAGYISRIAVHPHNSDTVIVVFSNYSLYSLFYTINGGDSWIKGAGNLEAQSSGGGSGPSLGCVEILPRDDGTLYFVGTSIGAFVTHQLDTFNTEWTQIGTNQFGNAIVEDIKARETDGLVAFGTYGKGIYTTHINLVTDIFPGQSVNELNLQEADLKVYPNPASDIIYVSWDLKTGFTNISIFDLSGKLVMKKDFNNSMKESINIESFIPGTYICKVSSPKGSISKNFIVQ